MVGVSRNGIIVAVCLPLLFCILSTTCSVTAHERFLVTGKEISIDGAINNSRSPIELYPSGVNGFKLMSNAAPAGNHDEEDDPDHRVSFARGSGNYLQNRQTLKGQRRLAKGTSLNNMQADDGASIPYSPYAKLQRAISGAGFAFGVYLGFCLWEYFEERISQNRNRNGNGMPGFPTLHNGNGNRNRNRNRNWNRNRNRNWFSNFT